MTEPEVGVGPWVGAPPADERFDPRLLEEGDRRNVEDRYRYWRHEAIVADLDTRRHPLHVAVENWEHDFNIGSIVRTANAFGARSVHVVGRRVRRRQPQLGPAAGPGVALAGGAAAGPVCGRR